MRTPAVFGAQRQEGASPPAATLPQAIRPAVEIIARLSAERARLRAELARARAGSAESTLKTELEQVKRERDSLRAEVERLRAARVSSRPSPATVDARPSPALQGLVERLERSLGRLESATRDVQLVSGQFGRQDATPETPAQPDRRPARERRSAPTPASPTSGNGMMATLLRQNLSLRGDSQAAPRPAPKAPGSANPLAALARQNAELRAQAPTRARRSPNTPAHPLAGLVAENKALRRTSRPGDTKSRAA